ncbi:MAG TPA: methylmalonyl-CoA epimerase [Solirubrobacteraceae bacterium]|nr:methylmalonyl-CoA epimerase [Solirubrobacteraceae bacterium]
MFGAIDHTGIAVADLEHAVAFYRGVLGLTLVHRETLTEQGVEAALLDIGDAHIELITPLRADSTVAGFLQRRGPGLHHLAYRVEDIHAELSRLAAAGVQLIDETPRIGIRGSHVAFLHPASTGGVLTELVQPAVH